MSAPCTTCGGNREIVVGHTQDGAEAVRVTCPDCVDGTVPEGKKVGKPTQ